MPPALLAADLPAAGRAPHLDSAFVDKAAGRLAPRPARLSGSLAQEGGLVLLLAKLAEDIKAETSVGVVKVAQLDASADGILLRVLNGVPRGGGNGGAGASGAGAGGAGAGGPRAGGPRASGGATAAASVSLAGQAIHALGGQAHARAAASLTKRGPRRAEAAALGSIRVFRLGAELHATLAVKVRLAARGLGGPGGGGNGRKSGKGNENTHDVLSCGARASRK